jgi:predicted ferric reductase
MARSYGETAGRQGQATYQDQRDVAPSFDDLRHPYPDEPYAGEPYPDPRDGYADDGAGRDPYADERAGRGSYADDRGPRDDYDDRGGYADGRGSRELYDDRAGYADERVPRDPYANRAYPDERAEPYETALRDAIPAPRDPYADERAAADPRGLGGSYGAEREVDDSYLAGRGTPDAYAHEQSPFARFAGDRPTYAAGGYAEPAADPGFAADAGFEAHDPFLRSDIVVEAPADPSGWRGSGPAIPIDDRPPSEATSGNRLLTVLLFFAGLATSVSLWLFDTQAGAIDSTPTLLLAVGRVTGLVAGYLLFIQLLMMSRVSWLEEWVGSRDLLRWHRWLGTSLVVAVLTHIVFIVFGYAKTAETGVVAQSWTIVTTFPSMISAAVATGILVLISLISMRAARSKLPYELWHLIHLGGYLVLLLGYAHQVATGADLSGRFASVFWPGLSALVIAALIWGRLVEPLWLNVRHRFEVAEVVGEGTNTFSIYIDGKNLDKIPAKAGQFMRWRFLTRNGWWQSHPFSLSAAPNPQWLRLTVTAVGGHTARLAEMEPGTPIWAEGPFGTFTAQRRTRRRALLIAGGSGIAPIRALLEDMPADTIVIYRASRPDELVFREELEDLAERRDAWVRYIVGNRNDAGPRRLFTPDGMLGLVPDVNRRDVYLCGPPGLVDAAVATLRELEVPDSQLHLDPFEF